VSAFLSEALTLAASRSVVSDVGGRFSLDRAADAYRALDAGVAGKVLVLPHLG
jgi:NADPH2:quinone reductase